MVMLQKDSLPNQVQKLFAVAESGSPISARIPGNLSDRLIFIQS